MATMIARDDVTEENRSAVLEEWLDRLTGLVDLVEGWVKDRGWATRRISKRMEDSRLGDYRAPALIMQRDLVQIALEPIGRFAPRCDGVVDLYLMPEFDDIATLYYADNRWKFDYTFEDIPLAVAVDDAEEREFSEVALDAILAEMIAHAE